MVPDGTEVICKQCYKEKAIERVFIPKSVREIQDSAFEDCKSLREVIFEEGSRLKKIGVCCFCESGLEEIVIPSSVTGLERSAFSSCKSLKKVTF